MSKRITDMTDSEFDKYMADKRWSDAVYDEEGDDAMPVVSKVAKGSSNSSGYLGGPHVSGTTGYGTGSYLCRHDATWLFQIGRCHLYGGSSSNVLSVRGEFDLVIDLHSGVGQATGAVVKEQPKPIVACKNAVVPKELLVKLPPPVPPKMMYVEWPDYGVPAGLGRKWWVRLWSYLRGELEPAKSDSNCHVLFYCVGGHGRTGTMAAILAGLEEEHARKETEWYYYEVEDNPVDYIRDIYCEECVESKSQIAYIGGILGLPNLKDEVALPDKGWKGGKGTALTTPYTPVIGGSGGVVPPKTGVV